MPVSKAEPLIFTLKTLSFQLAFLSNIAALYTKKLTLFLVSDNVTVAITITMTNQKQLITVGWNFYHLFVFVDLFLCLSVAHTVLKHMCIPLVLDWHPPVAMESL